MNRQFAEIRLALFQLLQAAYTAPATPELAEALREVAAVYLDLVERPAPPLGLPDGAADVAEFHRLFVGPGALVAPPYESVYLSTEKVLMQAETLAVREFYRSYGKELAPDHREPDDFLAFELEFYAYLQTQVHGLEAMQRFCTEHLERWVPTFCERVITATRSPFYRSLAEITREVILTEGQVLTAIAQ
ncbi:MAG TPA: molecular chaperone TorD family protein [Symbiobacteriaceae bacterium]|nr:molecular chaperone TorD family protein [Symbiobacteriaceae bacterium]